MVCVELCQVSKWCLMWLRKPVCLSDNIQMHTQSVHFDSDFLSVLTKTNNILYELNKIKKYIYLSPG